jgi:hypothetical protein
MHPPLRYNLVDIGLLARIGNGADGTFSYARVESRRNAFHGDAVLQVVDRVTVVKQISSRTEIRHSQHTSVRSNPFSQSGQPNMAITDSYVKRLNGAPRLDSAAWPDAKNFTQQDDSGGIPPHARQIIFQQIQWERVVV